MATKPKAQTQTPAQIQRALAKKYGVIPCPFWFDFYALKMTIDGEVAEVGSEIVFKSASGTVCGAGVVFKPGMMRMSPCYADDPYDPRVTGALYGEEIELYLNGTDRLYYAPIVKHPGGYMKFGLNALRTVDIGSSTLEDELGQQ